MTTPSFENIRSPLDEVRAAVAAGVRVGPTIAGKPYYSSWRQRATRNVEVFDRLNTKLPDASWLAPLGRQVIAIRAKGDEGLKNLWRIEAELGPLPQTISISSPNYSVAALFSVSQPTATVDLAPGVRALGLGRSLALPPSLHRSTLLPYTWGARPTRTPLAPLPNAWGARIASLAADLLDIDPVPNVRRFPPPSAPRQIAA